MTYNTGDIKFSRTLSESEYDRVKKFIAEKWPGFTEKYQEVHLDFDGVSLCGTVEPDIVDFIDDLAKAVEPLGISLSGSVEYYGDSNGAAYIKQDGTHNYGALDRWKEEATNQEILDVLRQRLDEKTTSLAAPDPNGKKREARPANPFIGKTTDEDLARFRKMMEDIEADPFDRRIQARINREAKSFVGNTKWWEIIAVYENADAKGRAACDDLLTALCGWTMHTILHSILLSPADTTTHDEMDEMTSTPASMAQQRERPGMKVNNITGNVKEAASLSDLADVTFENNRLVLRVDDPIAARKFGLSDKTYRYEFDGRTMFWFYDKDESKPSNWGCSCGKGNHTLVDTGTKHQIKTVKDEMAHQVVEKKMLDIFGSNKQFTYVAIELNGLFYFDRNDRLHLR